MFHVKHLKLSIRGEIKSKHITRRGMMNTENKPSALNIILMGIGVIGLIAGFIMMLNSGVFETLTTEGISHTASGLFPLALGVIFLSILCTAVGVGITMKKQLAHRVYESEPIPEQK